MRNAKILEQAALEIALADLTGWSVEDGHLCRTFRFESFVQAFGFMAAAALEAEKLDHHPDWSNLYNQVHVRLRTHTPDGLTTLDLDLAQRMSALAD